MATPTPAPVKPINTNPTTEQVAKAKARLDDLREQAMKRTGEKGFNPFLWIRSILAPIDPSSSEGFKTAMSLELPAKMDGDGVKEVPGATLKVPVPKS